MTDVYWSFQSGEGPYKDTHNADLLTEPPSEVIQDLHKNNHIRSDGFKEYIRCPSYPEYFKNTYVIKSVADFKLSRKVNDDGIVEIFSNKDQLFFDNIINVKYYTSEQQLVQLDWFTVFFSESDVNISVTPAFLHDNNFVRNTKVLPGKMNISKWYRAVQASFIMLDDIDVRVGDALYYVKFETNDKIELKHFDQSDELLKYNQSCTTTKINKSGMKLEKLYNLFTKRNYNKKIMREIKKNLTGDFE